MSGEVGASAIVDRSTLRTTGTTASHTQWAPGIALALGYAFALDPAWSLDLFLRSQHLFFESTDGIPPDGQSEYGTTQIVSLGATLAYRF